MNINKLILSLVFVISTIAIVSCDQEYNSSKSITIKEDSRDLTMYYYKFSCDGHNYIYFNRGSGKYESGGVIHDPECCK